MFAFIVEEEQWLVKITAEDMKIDVEEVLVNFM